MRKLKIGFTIIILLVILVLSIFVIKKKLIFEYKIDPDVHKYYIEDEIGREELIVEVSKKNNDWSKLPLSKNFRKKYNSKEGILGKIQFDTIELNHFKDGEKSYIGGTNHLYIKNGKQEIVYFYGPKYTYTPELYDVEYLDDVELIGPIYVTDESGQEIDFRFPFSDNYKIENLRRVVNGGEDESSVAVTDKFHKKYPFFLDLFIHYSPLSYNDIKLIEKESDIDNNVAIFEVDSILECKVRKYEVKLILDEKLYLDDAEVNLIETKEYRGDGQYTTLKILYKNSNWDNIKITDKYRKKFDGNSFINDIDNIDINYFSESKKIGNHEFLRKYRTINGEYAFYYGKLIYTDDEKIDDAECNKLSYEGALTLDEVAERFIKQHSR